MNRLDHTLGNVCITHIIPLLPAGVLNRIPSETQVEKIKCTVSIDRNTLRVKFDTLKILDEKDELCSKYNGAIIAINENEFTIVCTIFLSGVHQPVLLTEKNAQKSLLTPFEKARELDFVVLKRYYELPKNKTVITGEFYDAIIDVETQTVVSFDHRGAGAVTVEKVNDGQVKVMLYAANGGLNAQNAPMRIGDKNYCQPVGTQAQHQDFQSLFVSNKGTVNYLNPQYSNTADFDRSRFGKLWLNMDAELIKSKLKNPRIKLKDNDSTFFSWWFNTPLVDAARKEGETPVIFKVEKCGSDADKVYTAEPFDVNTAHCGELYHGLLPRTVGESWCQGLTADEIAHVLMLKSPKVGNDLFHDIEHLYFYKGEEHIADAVAKIIFKKQITSELEKLDADIALLQKNRAQLVNELKSKLA